MIFYRKSLKCYDFLFFYSILGKKLDINKNCDYNS